MRTFIAKIEGVAPFRMNKPNLGTITPKKVNEDWLIKDAYDKCHTNGKGEYIITKEMQKKAIVNGASKVRLGRGKAKGEMKAIMFPIEDAILKHEKENINISKTIVRIPPRTGALVPKYFIDILKWHSELKFTVWDDAMPEEIIEQVFINAGFYFGLGAGIPEYGRFILLELKNN